MNPPPDTAGPTAPSEPRAGIYTRISSDHGDGLGVARQERSCRQLLTQIGGTLAGIYCDNDQSAYAATRRPAYERLLVDVAEGRVDLVIAWHPDRLYRRHQDLIRFVDTVEAARAQVATVRSGLLDLSTASGRMVARVVGAVAQHEVEQQGERIKLKQKQLAERGKWGGGQRPYGYRPTGDGGLAIVDPEAAVIRDSADRILHGETVYGVTKSLNRRNVPARGGGTWTNNSLRRILTSPTTCGLRVRQGAIVGPGKWKPILDEPTVELLALVVTNSPRRSPGRSRTGLLSPWLITCGRCGAPLHSRDQGKTRAYQCNRPPQGAGCGRLAIVETLADQVIKDAVFHRLATGDRPRFPVAASLGVDVQRATVVLEAQLRRLAAERSSQRLSDDEWQTARQPLLASLDEAQTALHSPRWNAALARASRPDAIGGELWDRWPLAEQQDLVEAVVGHVTVRPRGPRGGWFDPDRILAGTTWR